MQAPPDSTTESPRSRRERYRPILAVMSLLFVLALVLILLWPPGGSQPVGAPAQEPPVSADPPAPAQPADPVQPGPSQPPADPARPVPDPKPAPGPKPLPALPDPPGDLAQLVVHGSRECRQVALTYDAGSGADGAAAILDTLKRQHVKATFFLTGRWVERYPDLAKRVAAEGHLIANHTYSHPDLTKLTPAELQEEVRKGEEAIRQVTGRETRPFFREPYGAFNDEERRLVRAAGFPYSIYWELDTLDWQFPPVDTLTDKLITRTQSGSVVLMHLNVPDSAIASDRAIPVLREKGFEFVTVDQLLRCK